MIRKIDEILNLFSRYPDIQEMFKESEKCFKVEAYRAALLFAFSAFMKVLSKKILENGQPSTVGDGEWVDVCNKLRSDDSIEEQVLKCVQSKDNKYFQINQSLKEEMTKWKNSRNACAHWKDELIDEFVVENFYSFILFYQYKFSLKTSAENATKELYSVFDVGVSRSSALLEQKVKALPYLLADNEIGVFCEKVTNIPYSISDECADVVDAIIKFAAEKYKIAITKFFRGDHRRACDLLEKKSHLLPYIFSGDNDYEILLKSDGCYYRNRQMIALSLRKRGELTNSLLQVFFETSYNEDQHAIIDECKDLIGDCSDLFLTYIRDGKVSYTLYGDINSKADLIYQLLSYRQIDAEIIGIWNNFFADKNAYSWHLRERFEYDDEKRKQYNRALIDYAAKNNLKLNEKLFEILNGNL